MKAASLALLLLLTPHLCAQETEVQAETACVTVDAPQSCRIGELVRLDASLSVADSITWILIPESVKDIEIYDSGRRAVFSARTPGEYRFIVACAKDGSVDVKTFTITASGPPARPTTDDLSAWIHYWMWSYELPRDQADALAKSFSDLATRGDLTEPQDWIKATAEANREALGDNITAWIPLLDKIGSALLKKAQDGALMTPEQHSAVWIEIAEGLRKG